MYLVSSRASQRGSALVWIVTLTMMFMFAALIVDGARIYSDHRKLQSLANGMATELSGESQTCYGTWLNDDATSVGAGEINAALQRTAGADSGLQAFVKDVSVTRADLVLVEPEDGQYRVRPALGIASQTNGVAVTLSRPVGGLLGFTMDDLTASAVVRKEVYATFYTESFTAELSTANSPLLEPIFRYVLGNNQLTLKTLSLEQLAHTLIDLEGILHYITGEMPLLGDLGLNHILGSEIPAHLVVGALKTVDGLTKDTVQLLDDVINSLGVNTNIKLGDVVGVLGDGAVNSGAKIPLLETLAGVVMNLAQRPPFNGVIELGLNGLTGAMALDDNIEVKLEIEIDNPPRPVIAPARYALQEDGSWDWLGTTRGADIKIRLMLLVNLGDKKFSLLKLAVPIELSTGATTAKLVGARCASGADNTVDFSFEVERSVLSLSTLQNEKYPKGIELLVLGASEEPKKICFPAIAPWACPTQREDVEWFFKYKGLFGEQYGDCCYPPIEVCGRGLLDVQISSTPVEGQGVPSVMLNFDQIQLDDFESRSAEASGNTGEVLRKSISNLIRGIQVEKASLACIPLDGVLNFTLDILAPVLDGLLYPVTDILLDPLLKALGVDLATATVHVIAADQPAITIFEGCDAEFCSL